MHFAFMLHGVKCAQKLSANALERVRRRVYEYDAQSKEKKCALKKNVRKKIIKDKNWSMLRKMFNESPPVRGIQICIFFCWIRIQYYMVFNKITFFSMFFLQQKNLSTSSQCKEDDTLSIEESPSVHFVRYHMFCYIILQNTK